MEIMGTTTENTIFIGDQLFTDVYGAKRAGIRKMCIRDSYYTIIRPKREREDERSWEKLLEKVLHLMMYC